MNHRFFKNFTPSTPFTTWNHNPRSIMKIKTVAFLSSSVLRGSRHHVGTAPNTLSPPPAAPLANAGPLFFSPNPLVHSASYVSRTAPLHVKPGVASPEELREFVEAAGDRLVVVDVRNPDGDVEPGDAKSLAVAGFPSEDGSYRPKAVNLVWDRNVDGMPLPGDDVAKDDPIITHCGGGGRGQKAKDFLEEKGYTNVLNGGGPKETECWNEYGEK